MVTGQPIGFVGRTGDATACHLHFEMWPAPGWYTGGSAVDPLPSLKAWDVAGCSRRASGARKRGKRQRRGAPAVDRAPPPEPRAPRAAAHSLPR